MTLVNCKKTDCLFNVNLICKKSVMDIDLQDTFKQFTKIPICSSYKWGKSD